MPTMKKILLAAILLAPTFADAQFGGLLNKVKSKTQQRIDNQVDKAIDKSLDQAEGKVEAKAPAKGETANATGPGTNAPAGPAPLTSYSRYDFVPGEKIVYAEDFSGEAIGELPINWNTGGRAEVVTLNAFGGKWLRLFQNAVYLTSNKDTFSRNFSIEFDVIFNVKPNGWLYPEFTFGFLASNDLPTNDNILLREWDKFAAVATEVHLGEGSNTRARIQSYLNNSKNFYSEAQGLPEVESAYGKITHVSMQVQDRRLRVWFNGKKKYDLPMAVNQAYPYNQLFFHLSSSNYEDDMLTFYIGNLKVAKGKPDTRHKLLEEGRFSTTGILFDQGSAVIRPESAGVLKEIGATLSENATVKVQIVGHTSSEGDDAANLELSKQRAAAVRDYLVKEHGVDGARISTEGKGESKPAADNKTREGRAQNRRVEFIKL
jgi:OOP family OmpA-OmpF porin